MKKALVVVHPHEEYDHGVVGEQFEEYVQSFEGDTYVVPSVKSDRCERPYGDAEIYDEVLEEDFYGSLKEEDNEFLETNYDEVILAGGYARECLRNTHQGISGRDVQVNIEPEITYDQTFRNTEGFTLSEVIATGDKEIIGKFLEPFNNGETGLV